MLGYIKYLQLLIRLRILYLSLRKSCSCSQYTYQGKIYRCCTMTEFPILLKRKLSSLQEIILPNKYVGPFLCVWGKGLFKAVRIHAQCECFQTCFHRFITFAMTQMPCSHKNLLQQGCIFESQQCHVFREHQPLLSIWRGKMAEVLFVASQYEMPGRQS